MSSPIFHLENPPIETFSTTSVARQPVIENMTEGLEILPLASLALAVAGVAYALYRVKVKNGPLEDVLKDKPYEQ